METSSLVERVQDLTDLELAILLSLVASEHCIIQTESNALEPLEQELRLVQLPPKFLLMDLAKGLARLLQISSAYRMLFSTVMNLRLWKSFVMGLL